jgi:hypothetical protein
MMASRLYEKVVWRLVPHDVSAKSCAFIEISTTQISFTWDLLSTAAIQQSLESLGAGENPLCPSVQRSYARYLTSISPSLGMFGTTKPPS